MSIADDYRRSWETRQRYWSEEARAERDIEAQANHNEQQALRARRLAAQAPAPQGPGQGGERPAAAQGGGGAGARNVFGGAGPAPAVFEPRPGSPEGSFSAQAQRFGMFLGEIAEHGGDAVPSAGVGLLSMAGNVLDLGAHVLGVEEGYRELADWATRNVELYRPQTLSGQFAAPIAQVAVPYAGTARLLQAAGISRLLSGFIAAGTAEGIALAPGDDNLGDMLRNLNDTAPEVAPTLRHFLVDALAKTDAELQALASAGEGFDAAGFDAEAYREAYFISRAKNAVSGLALEGLGEGLFFAAKQIYRLSRTAMTDPAAAVSMMGAAARNTAELAAELARSPMPGSAAAQRGSLDIFRDTPDGDLSAREAASAFVASPVESALAIAREAATRAPRTVTHNQLAALLPPETRRAEGWEPGRAERYTMRNGRPFIEADLDGPAAPGVAFSDDEIDAIWHEAVDWMEGHGFDAQGVLNDLRSMRNADGARVKEARPREAAFWNRALQLPGRARYWYELSAEGMRAKLPELDDREFEAFVDLVALTSQSTPPAMNMARAMGVLSQTLREVPSEQDVIDPGSVLRALGQANEGLKVGSFGGTFLHHLGLRDMPQLSTNDTQVAASFGMGPSDIAQNPVMYGAISRFYQGLRDNINARLPAGAEPVQTWQLQALGWVGQRGESGNVDVDDYLDVLDRLSERARAAGVPVGPGGEFTREALMDPRLDSIMSGTIATYRSRLKAGLPITGRGNAYPASVGLRRELEALGDPVGVREWVAMERRALRAMVSKVSVPGERFTRRGQRERETLPSPATALANAITGRSQSGTRAGLAIVDGADAARIPLPADASPLELQAWLATMGQELGQRVVRAGRFRYIEPSADPGLLERPATSVLYQQPAALTAAQVGAFRAALGEQWHVDAHIAPNGTVLDVHPLDGAPAAPEDIEAAVMAAGLRADAARVVWSDYSAVEVGSGAYGRVLARWRADAVRTEAEPFARALGGMGQARAVIQGAEEIPPDLAGGKAARALIESARRRVRERFAALDAARERVREVRARLDEEAASYVERHDPRLERLRRQAARRRRED